jgi:hypothetical protein
MATSEEKNLLLNGITQHSFSPVLFQTPHVSVWCDEDRLTPQSMELATPPTTRHGNSSTQPTAVPIPQTSILFADQTLQLQPFAGKAGEDITRWLKKFEQGQTFAESLKTPVPPHFSCSALTRRRTL